MRGLRCERPLTTRTTTNRINTQHRRTVSQFFVIRSTQQQHQQPKEEQERPATPRNTLPNLLPPVRFDNYELLIGDTLGLVTFCTYKQIAAIALSPDFPGWLAPLKANPERFLEFISFAITITGTWIGVGLLTQAYASDATSSLPTALSRTCRTWIASMPIAAAQLVLLISAKDGALVGTEGWAEALPLAASGPGEPFVTAAGVLGLLAVWRSFYSIYLDLSKFFSIDGARSMNNDREINEKHFWESLRTASALALGSCVVLHVLSNAVPDSSSWW